MDPLKKMVMRTNGGLRSKIGSGAGSVAQWWIACLVCTRPWVPFPAWKKQNKQTKCPE
jgi:hypothetical protein